MSNRSSLAGRLVSLLIAAGGAGLACPSAAAEGQRSLMKIETQVERDYPRVPSLIPQHVAQLLRERRDVLVLDVREADEFAISHLAGAVRVDPGMSAAEFQRRFGADLRGRTVIVYCSVGVRSSKLAERVEAVTRGAGVAGVYNLRGGIFAWHNFGLNLHQGTNQTPFVHPYSRSWSRYLDFPNYSRTQPRG